MEYFKDLDTKWWAIIVSAGVALLLGMVATIRWLIGFLYTVRTDRKDKEVSQLENQIEEHKRENDSLRLYL
jgi:putative effector of murein hydrolase LrgA (UPF0299 family)